MGPRNEENLWQACFVCNNAKGTQTRGLNPETGAEVLLFNPRTQSWREHFAWSTDGTEAPVLECNSAGGGGDHGSRNRTERPGPTCERHEYRSGFILRAALCELLRLDMRSDDRRGIWRDLRVLSLHEVLAEGLKLLESEVH